MAKKLYQAYAQATETVARTQQILMLYDGAIRFMSQAAEAQEKGEIEPRYHLLVKVADIIGGLQGCLDFDKGGEVARTLYSYYALLESRIFALHRENNNEAYQNLISDLKKMRDAWAEIDAGMAKSPASPASATIEEPQNSAAKSFSA